MKPSVRYGLVGVGALGVVSLVHFARGLGIDGPQFYRYALGVLPNTAAAVALPFAFMGIWSHQNPLGTYSATKRWFIAAGLVSAIGLVAWEFLQPSRGRVFDPHDIGATIIGIGLAWFLFYAFTPNRRAA